MRRSIFFAFLLVLPGCGDGCNKKPDAAPVDAAPPLVFDAGGVLAPLDSGVLAEADAAAPKHDMGNCPTAVPGATTALKDTATGIEVTFTGPDEATGTQIRERMKKLAENAKNDVDAGHLHNHSGSGGGRMGRCTIVIRNTTIATADVPNGTKVTVVPKDKTELDWLRRETRDRDREAKTAGAEGAGSQRMAHCPSAVEGARTAVKDLPDGVVVTVTATAPASTKEIRDRAKHTADVAKKGEPAHPEHSGDGTGGGALGRCPIVVEGETTVGVIDVDGGAEIRVTTKKDPAALQKETRTRAGNFASK